MKPSNGFSSPLVLCSKLKAFSAHYFSSNLHKPSFNSILTYSMKMIGVEQESTEAHKLPSTSGQPSLDVRSPLTEAAAKLLYKRMRVRLIY